MAAGPYNPWTKYGGPERIAITRGYISKAKSKSSGLQGFVKGENHNEIDKYLPRYDFKDALDWAVKKFRFATNDDLELFTTVDFATIEMRQKGEAVTVESVRKLIESEPEWAPKLNRKLFSKSNVQRAIATLQKHFSTDYE